MQHSVQALTNKKQPNQPILPQILKRRESQNRTKRDRKTFFTEKINQKGSNTTSKISNASQL
jgi:hypothetical protein